MNTIKKLAVSMMVLLSCIGLSACGSSTGDTSVTEADTVQSEITEAQVSADEVLLETENTTTKNSAEIELNEDIPLSNEEQPQSEDTDESTGAETIVVYFSATGTTKGVAERIASVTNADIYELIPAEPYSDVDLDWNDKNSRTTIEMNDPNVRPAIANDTVDLNGYTTVYIGYPIWWGDAPRMMSTFVEAHDFDGKTVIPFCTSGGSGIGRSGRNLASQAGNGNWLDGDRLDAGISESEIEDWINDMN